MQDDRPHGGWLRLSEKQLAAAGVGLQAATALVVVRFSWKLARGIGKTLLGLQQPASRPAPPAHDGAAAAGADEEESGPVPTAAQQWPPTSLTDPAAPGDATPVAEGRVEVGLYRFYELFLSSESTFLQDHHRAQGQLKFAATRWKADGDGLARCFTFQQPKKGGLMSLPADCKQRQRLSRHPGDVLVLTTDTTMTGVPCCDQFRVQSYWRVAPAGSGACLVTIQVAVPFSRPCLLQGVIRGTTLKDCRAFFGAFLASAQQAAGGPPRLGLGAAPPSSAASAVDAEVVLAPAAGKHQQQQQQQQQPAMLRPWGSAFTAQLVGALAPPGMHPAAAAATAAAAAAHAPHRQQLQQQHLHHLSLQSSLLLLLVLLQLYIVLRGRVAGPCGGSHPQQQLEAAWCAGHMQRQAVQDMQL